MINRLLVAALFFLFFTTGYGQLSVDSVYEKLTERQRLGLLFISGDVSSENVGYRAVDAADLKNDSDGEKNSFVADVSAGFTDEIKFPFPGYHVLDLISDTVFIEDLMKNTCMHFRDKGASGIIFKYSGDPSLNNSPYFFLTTTQGHFVMKRLPVFENLPLLKQIKSKNIFAEKLPFAGQHTYFKKWIGLVGGNPEDMEISFEELLKKGAYFYTSNPEKSIDKLLWAFKNKILDREMVDKYVKQALMLKELLKDSADVLKPVNPDTEDSKLRWEAWVRSLSVIRKTDMVNGQFFVPKNETYGLLDLAGFFKNEESRYAAPEFTLSGISKPDSSHIADRLIVIASDKDTIPENELKKLKKDYRLDLIYAGKAKRFKERWSEEAGYFDKIMFFPGTFPGTGLLLQQAMFGGIAVKGAMPFMDVFAPKGFTNARYNKLRIGYGFPGMAGMKKDSLLKIDSVLNVIVKKKMAPGGQVLVAKDGYVVYDRSFGYTTYRKKVRVDYQKIYDLASLTKIIVTVPLVMKLYDEKKIRLDSAIRLYLPNLDTLETGNLTIRQLLLHQAGLPSYIPFHFDYVDSTSFRGSMYSGKYSRTYSIRLDKYFFFNRNVRYKTSVFRKRPDSVFNVRLSDGMYMNYHYLDSIFKRVYHVKLKKKKEYLYSDVGYFFIQKIIERQTGKKIDELFREWFTGPMGIKRLVYQPLKYFPKSDIVPTDKDMIFRKSLLQGYASDDGAAMLGGVAAHAGLFGNARDIAVFAQMLLNKGSYGGVSYIKPRTISLFTSVQNDRNRRGLGFDKPEYDPGKDTPASVYASPLSYGHSGFTGTFLWVDPEYGLTYIFLSNRVYPYCYNKKLIEENIRTGIQDIVYRSFLPEEKIEQADTLR